MSKVDKITVTNYEPQRFSRLQTTLAEKGLKGGGSDSGEIKKFGADVQYTYNPDTQILILEVLHGPHLHNYDDFVKQLTSWIEEQV